MKADISWHTTSTTLATVSDGPGEFRVFRAHSTWRCDCPIDKGCIHISLVEGEIAGL
jgi:hypothetical protein